MASNFDFLKEIDKGLFSLIEDAEKLFRDGYFNQCSVQLRIFAEKTAKKVLGESASGLTFDDTINCLKDRIKSEREKEFVEDLFYQSYFQYLQRFLLKISSQRYYLNQPQYSCLKAYQP